jgi:DNA-binding protein H-NS
MSDFNLATMSLADLRDLQKSVAKAISTFEVRQKAEAREKVEMLAKDLGFTLAELAELEEPKRKRAPSTKIYGNLEFRTLT